MTVEVLLSFSLYDPLHTSATPQQILQKLAGVAASSLDDDLDEATITKTHSLDSDLEGEDDDLRHESEVSDTNPLETPEKRKRRLKLAKIKRQATRRAYEFSGMSDVAGVLFLEISKIVDLPPERNSELSEDVPQQRTKQSQ